MIVPVLIITLHLIHVSCTSPKCKSFEYGTQRTKTYLEAEADSKVVDQTACDSEQQYTTDINTELFQGKYNFNVTSIPRLECEDPEAFQYLKREVSVLLGDHRLPKLKILLTCISFFERAASVVASAQAKRRLIN